MRRSLITALVLASSALLAPAALATTQTASGGAVTATFTFSGHYPNYSGLHLRIAQSGSVLYDQPVSSKACGPYCAPGATATQDVLGACHRPRSHGAAQRRARPLHRRRPLLLGRAGVHV